MNEPLVSIFCPSYNHENFVEEMLQSLISQTYKNIEIIIIDDCSNDKTPQIIQAFAEVHPDKIKFIKGVANLGVAERWNQMLKIIKGDYLACVGSDDILPINAIENRVNYLVEHPTVDFLLTEFDIISDDGKIYYGKDKLEIAPQFERFYKIEDISKLYEMLLVGNFIQIGAGLIRIKSYSIDEIMLNKNLPNLHDYDQLLKLIYGHKVAFFDKSTYLYRYHKNSTSSQDNPKKNPREVGAEMEVILLEQLKKKQNVKERIRTLETILNGRTEPDNSWKLNVVIEAEEYILNNQLKEAEELLLYLITRDSTNIDALINLGVIAANENKLEDSRQYFLNVLALDSQNELAIENLAFVEEALNLDKSGTLKFTGERFIPEENGQIAYEHFNRYLMANEYVAGKDVLDIASGEGYGSALLANLAKSVVGVDISEEAVSHASNKYGDKDNLEFKVGDCVNIPCNDNQFDIVVSFETIEHIMEQEKFLSEIKRVLKKDGKLIISSPNKSIYSNDEYQNEFHLKELTFEEFQKLLSEHFENTTLFGQRITFSSHIWPINVKDGHILFKNYTIKENELQNITPYEPEYLIAICSNVELNISQSASLYTADDDILFKEYHNRGKWGIDLDKELNETKEELNQVKQQYSELVKEHQIILNSLKNYSNKINNQTASTLFNEFSNIEQEMGKADEIGLNDYEKKIKKEIEFYANSIVVHDLPQIHHTFSSAFLSPHLKSNTGFESYTDWWIDEIDNLIENSGKVVNILSLGCGNGDTELAFLKKIKNQESIYFMGLDINPNMVERANKSASENSQNYAHFKVEDLNNLKLEKMFDVFIANHSLHHLVNLEAIFGEVVKNSSDEMIFLINDMIGKNGHQMWVNAKEVVMNIWESLDLKYKFNGYFKKFDKEIMDIDCSTDGFEGIRAQDILPLLNQYFDIEFYFPFATIINRFTDRTYGHNFKVDDPKDVELILKILELDIKLLKEKKLSPTQAFIKAVKKGEAKTKKYLFQTPEDSINSRRNLF